MEGRGWWVKGETSAREARQEFLRGRRGVGGEARAKRGENFEGHFCS